MTITKSLGTESASLRIVAVVELRSLDPTSGSSTAGALRSADRVVEELRNTFRAEPFSGGIGKPHPQFLRADRGYTISVRAVRLGIPVICAGVAEICYAALLAGAYPRGAIVVGQADHTFDDVRGEAPFEASALVRAEVLPRVVVSQDADNFLSEFWEPAAMDADGTRFLNVFRGRMGPAYTAGTTELRARFAAQPSAPHPAAHAWLLQRMEDAVPSLLNM